MPRIPTPDNPKKFKRVSPRIDTASYQKLSVIAKRRGQNLSELTRDLYADLLRREFKSEKPAA
jgi:hypothetical protein